MRKLLLATALVAVLLCGQLHPVAALAAPTTADGFTQTFADKNDMTWSGGDQSTSYKAPNGKIYWLSGDTMLSNGEDEDGSYPDTGTVMVSNRILMQNGSSLENAMANGEIGVPNPATHTAENQERYWPQGMFYNKGYLYVLCQRVIKDTDPNSIGFKLIGTELAKYAVAKDGKLTFLKMVATPSTGVAAGVGPAYTQWAGDAIAYGGYVYIYGYTHAPKDNPDWAAHYSYVARVPSRQLESTSAWRFYSNSTKQWATTMNGLSTAVNNPDAIVASQISSVRLIGDKFVMTHKPWNGWGSTVYAEIGSTPEGPFTRKALFEAPAGTWEGKSYHTYGPMLHPEQTLGGAETGKILVSINWNGQDFWTDVLGNADLYKPRFYAVDLP